MIKDIIKNLKPSSTLLINEKSNKLEREGKKICLLYTSDAADDT